MRKATQPLTTEQVSLLSPRNRRWRLAIASFIAFNILAILIDCTRLISIRNPVRMIFYPYLKITHLLQIWPLFTPEPRRWMTKYRVDIRFQKGNVETWSRPYPSNWDFFDRHLSYNFQKWDLATETIEIPAYTQRDITNYILRMYESPSNPPTYISFVKTTADVPPPNPTGYVQHGAKDFKWKTLNLWTYDVKEKRYL